MIVNSSYFWRGRGSWEICEKEISQLIPYISCTRIFGEEGAYTIAGF